MWNKTRYLARLMYKLHSFSISTRLHLILKPTFAPGLNHQDEAGRSQIHKAQIRKDEDVVALGAIQNIAAQPWTQRSG